MRFALTAAAAATLLIAPAAVAQDHGHGHGGWSGGAAPSGGGGYGGGFAGRQAPSAPMGGSRAPSFQAPRGQAPAMHWGGGYTGAPNVRSQAYGQRFNGQAQAQMHAWRPSGDRGSWNGHRDWDHDGGRDHNWRGGGWRGYYPYYGGYYDPWVWGGVGFGVGATFGEPYYYGGYDTYYDGDYDAPPPPDYGCNGWVWDPAAQQYFWGSVAC